MSTRPRPTLLLSAIALALPVLAPAAPGASGTFHVSDQPYAVADAMAWRDGDDLKLVFSDTPFDRAAFADDGELDSFDFMRHDGVTLTLTVDPADGTLSGMGTQSGGMSSYMTGVGETLTLAGHGADTIAGTFSIGEQPGITFDLPIASSQIQRPGEALPADGGEPGKVLLARVAAIHAGDIDALMENTPPDQAAEMRAAVESGEAEQLMEMAKMFTPTDIRITGGSQDGDTAWVDFTGMDSGGQVTGIGKLLRSDGRWQVESLNTSQSGD